MGLRRCFTAGCKTRTALIFPGRLTKAAYWVGGFLSPRAARPPDTVSPHRVRCYHLTHGVTGGTTPRHGVTSQGPVLPPDPRGDWWHDPQTRCHLTGSGVTTWPPGWRAARPPDTVSPHRVRCYHLTHGVTGGTTPRHGVTSQGPVLPLDPRGDWWHDPRTRCHLTGSGVTTWPTGWLVARPPDTVSPHRVRCYHLTHGVTGGMTPGHGVTSQGPVLPPDPRGDGGHDPRTRCHLTGSGVTTWPTGWRAAQPPDTVSPHRVRCYHLTHRVTGGTTPGHGVTSQGTNDLLF